MTTVQRVIIDVPALKVVRLKMPPDQHRSSLCDDIACRGEWGDAQWSPDSTGLAFVSTSRDHRNEYLRVAAAATGEVRTVLEERAPTFFESGNGRVSWKFLPASGEVIWFSQRDGWGQLYLYDLRSGSLKHPITTGEGNVTQLLRVDEQNRLAYFLGVGREKGGDPYFVHLYRVGLDGRHLQRLTPEDAQHDVAISPSGDYFVDSYSRPDVPPVTVLRRSDGSTVLELEKADISRLVASGWKPPIPFTVRARDGATALHGLMYRPTRLDETRKYWACEEPQGQAAARARHDGQQRAAVQHAAGRERVDQGQ